MLASHPTFLDSLAKRVEVDPHVVAVRDGDRRLSYVELWRASGRLAEQLLDLVGIVEEPALVAVEGDRSIELMFALVGVLRARMVCLPIDPTLPPGRRGRMLATAQPALHVTVRSADPNGAREIALAASGEMCPVLPASRAAGDVPAYVLFTSGSTGDPKGVVMGRRALTGLIDWHAYYDRTSVSDVTAQLAPISFDVAWQEIFATLTTGGTLQLVPEAGRRDPGELLRELRVGRVQRLFLPTSLLQTVAEAAAGLQPLAQLRDVIVAGSQLRITPAIREWFSTMDGCRLHNHYGPTESHVVTSHTLGEDPTHWPDLPPIGSPLPHVSIRIVEGELWLGGPALADGYLSQPGLTAERFVEEVDGRWYRTGDLVTTSGTDTRVLEYHGRIDRQLKIDGHRVEPAEVEAQLLRHPELIDAYVADDVDRRGRRRLVAYVVAKTDALSVSTDGELLVGRELTPPWRGSVAQQLTQASVPSVWVRLRALPVSTNGKIERARLPAVPRERPPLPRDFAVARTPTERALAEIWEEHLDLGGIGRDDSFFDLGGTSLLLASVGTEIRRLLHVDLPIASLYDNPTIATLAQHIEGAEPLRVRVSERSLESAGPVAVVGLSCRFPGAPGVDALWDVLTDGRDTITRLSDRPDVSGRVRAAGVLADVDRFDAELFGYSSAQARLLDPQHRLFLQCCWEALHDAACDSSQFPGRIGVFGGCGPSTYLLNNLVGSEIHTLTTSATEVGLLLGNDKDFLTSRVSYVLDLRGPSLNVNAACATALFAVHEAVRSLQSGSSDLALAGAASIQVPQLTGYLYEEGMPLSPDGRCRAFDRDAAGTVFGSGVGVLALKRLPDAVADGDDIYAVILGTGVSNDGGQKVGMTAPSVKGQVRAIRDALDAAAVDPATIRYVEAHGTGTPVGDPIEVAALHESYGDLPPGSCGIGSVKTNVGHLGWAAGVAGLIKAVLVLRHGRVPRTLHYREPNPELRLEQTPFFVTDQEVPFEATPGENRVAVSAFGLGGSNAHVILEGAPRRNVVGSSVGAWHVLPVSGRTVTATDSMLCHLESINTQSMPVADVARTLSIGRAHHAHRRAIVVAEDGSIHGALVRALDRPPTPRASSSLTVGIFPGHGAEKVGLGLELYRTQPVFRSSIDSFDDVLRSTGGRTVGEILYRSSEGGDRVHDVIEVHAVVFALQMALFRLWESKGFTVDILLGHSLGQYAAACAAGVFCDVDGMAVAIERARAIEATEADGSMASVIADEDTVRGLLGQLHSPVDVAAVNGPANVVISGLQHELDEATAAFARQGIEVRPLGSLRAGHSRLMASVKERLTAAFVAIPMRPPERVLISNVDGRRMTVAAATPEYWATHLRSTVRFADCLATARELGGGAFVELGGSPGLLGLAASTLDGHPGPWISVLRPHLDATRSLAEAVGTAYEAGLDPDWSAVVGSHGALTHLPTFDLQPRSHWVGPHPPVAGRDGVGDLDLLGRAVNDQAPIHRQEWRPAASEARGRTVTSCAVVGPPTPWREAVVAGLRQEGVEVVAADAGAPPAQSVEAVVLLVEPDAYDADIKTGSSDEQMAVLQRLVAPVLDVVASAQDLTRPPRFTVVTRSAQRVLHDDEVDPLSTAVWGLARSVAIERPEQKVRRIDVDSFDDPMAARLAAILQGGSETEVALRGEVTYCGRLVRVEVDRGSEPAFDDGHAYLVVGGFTGLGLRAAHALARAGARHIVLAGRRPIHSGHEQLHQLVGDRGSVRTVHLDVTDDDAVDALFADFASSATPVGGVVNCAGVLADCLLEDATWSRFSPVLGPKVKGSWNLHRASLRHAAPLSFFVLYSSAAAVHGNLGQAAYGTANAYLEGLAHARANLGLPGLAIDWGVWSGAGHVEANSTLSATLDARGFGAITPELGDRVLLRHLVGVDGQLMVLPNDWARFLTVHRLTDIPLYAELCATPTMNADDRPAPAGFALARRLAYVDAGERTTILTDHLLKRLTDYLGTPIGPEDDLVDVGLDSLSAVQLRIELQASLGIQLPPRLLTLHRTVSGISAHIVGEALLGWQPTLEDTPSVDGSGSAGSGLSIQQRRWLSLVRDVRYGQRVVPVLILADLDRRSFSAALRLVVARHDVLCRRYPDGTSVEELSVDEVVPPDGVLFVDLSDTPGSAQPEAIGVLLASLRDNMPDPATSAPWTIRCADLGSGKFLVVVAGQHLEFDGPGLSIFVDELREAYRSLAQLGEKPQLPEVTPYWRYVERQVSYFSSGIGSDRSFFQGLFAGVPRRTLLPGHGGGSVTTARPSRRHSMRLTSWPGVCEAARRCEVSPFAMVLASYAELVGEIVDEPTAMISVIRSARTDRAFANTIGPFTMPFPVPVHVRGWAPQDLCRQVDQTMASITGHSEYPPTDLIDATPVFAGLPIDTYFSDVGINFLNYRRPESRGEPHIEIMEVLGEVDHPLLGAYDFGELRRIPGLHLVAEVVGDDLVANYWFHVERFDADTVDAWGRRHQDLLEAMIDAEPRVVDR